MLGEGIRPVYASGECEIDLARRELRILGSPVPVGGRAFEIIEILAQAAGELVTKDELMNRIWPGAIVMENTLAVHAAAVRKALGPYRSWLKTETRRGYRLLGSWTVRRQDVTRPPVGLQKMRPAGQPPATNFPTVVTRVVGRAASVRQLQDFVSAYRIVTLVGPGGIGKTTLALKVARRILTEFEDGAWLVELASLSDPNLTPSAVARVLGLKLGGEEITAEAVARTLGGQHVLLVLDNCEHVIEAAANLAETLLRLCPRITILATSREVFRIDGECVYRVPPLLVPAVEQKEPEQILGHSAVELFIERTQALGADFSANANSLRKIATICRHLDGIPLAIEFAAARAAALGVEQIADALSDRFMLLTSGRRTAVARHRTLRAVLDWSYELLPEQEQRLFRHLAIFPAGFTIGAATAVMRANGPDVSAVVDGITNLVAKSLIVLDESQAPTRWHLLETTRAYALEKLAKHSEVEDAARRHAEHFRDLIAGPMSGFRSRVSSEDLRRHGRDIDDIRTALDWAFSPNGDTTIGRDITVAYAPVWMDLSLHAECCERCERALQQLAPGPASDTWSQMWLRIALGSSLVTTMGPSERAHSVLTEALDLANALNDLDAQARALSALVSVYIYRGEYGEAQIAVERLRQIAHHIGDSAIVVVAERTMGITLLTAGRLHEARECLEHVLRSPVTPDDQRRSTWHHSEHRAMARAMLARALWLQGFADTALAEAEASLGELQEIGHQLSVCRVLYYGICRIAPMIGALEAADRANTRLVEIATGLHAPFWITVGRFLEGKLMVARGQFAEGATALSDAFDTCRRTGWRMSYPEFKGALASALAGLGRIDESLTAVVEAIASAGPSATGQQWYVPELHRIRGDLLLQQAADLSTPAAEDCFRQASEMAREQGALFWELRVALSLARLRVRQGKQSEARLILAPVYDRFTEGFATTDLQAAKALLDELPAC
jgi:predicted ATPase/DNA-binding winged helix-turn-helix (wHTH) protein